MADNIKLGIQPEVTPSGKKDINQLAAEIDALQKQLKDELKLDVDTSDALKSLNSLRRGLQGFIEEQKATLLSLKRAGKEGTEAYAKVVKAIKQASQELQQLDKDATDIEVEIAVNLDTDKVEGQLESLTDLAKKAFAFEALERGGEFLSGVSDTLGDYTQSLRNVQAITGATGRDLERLQESASDLFRKGVGESLSDAVDAIAFADQQLGAFLDPKELEEFTRTSAGIAEVYDKDINEVLARSRTLIKNFELEGGEAGGLVSVLLRDASGATDDALETLDEYSQLLVQTGFNAQESTALLIKGVQEGARDTDKLADAIKEAQIRLRAGDITRALKDIQSPITEAIQGIVTAGEQGTISVKEVLQQTGETIEGAFDKGEISETIRAQLQAAIALTKAEDLGTDLYGKIFGAPIDTSNIQRAGDEARRALENAIAPTNVFDAALRAIEAFGTGALAAFQPAIAGSATLLTSISQVAPGITLLSSNFAAANKALAPFVTTLITRFLPGLAAQAGLTTAATGATVAQTVATSAQSAATVTATGALRALFATMLANPFFLVTAAVVGLGAALFAIVSSGESVAEALEDVNDQIDKTQDVLTETKKFDEQQDALLELADTYDALEKATDPKSQAEFTAATNELAAAFPEAVEGASDLGDQIKINTDVVRSFANAEKELNENIREGAIADLLDEMSDLAEATKDAQEEVGDLKEQQKALQDRIAEFERTGEVYDSTSLHVDEYRKKLQEVTSEIGEQSRAVLDGNTGLREGIDLARKGQASWEEIAEATELSVEEVKNYAKQLEAAELAAKKAERGVEGVHVQTIQAAERTKGLAEEWDKTAGSVSGAVDEMLKAIAFLILQSRQAANEASFFGINVTDAFRQAQTAILKTELREQIKLLKETEGILQDLKAEFGLVETSSKRTADGTTELLVNLSEAYKTAVRETQKLRTELKLTEDEIASDAFAGIALEFEQQTTEITDKFRDESKKINEEVEAQRDKLTKLLADKKKATLDISVTLDDGSVIEGEQAILETLARLDAQRVAELEKLRLERVEAEREAARAIFDERLKILQEGFDEEQALVRERYEFEIEFADETTVAGLEKLRDARIGILREEEEERVRGLVAETEAFKAGQAGIAKIFEDRVIAIQEAVRAGEITEEQARAERLVEEEKAAESLADLRDKIATEQAKDTASRVFKIVKASGKRQEKVIEEIGTKIAELTKEFDPYIDALESTTDILIKTWERYFDDLDQLREQDLQASSDQREQDIADLKKQLLDAQITYEEYTRALARIRAQDTEAAATESAAQQSLFERFGEILSDIAIEQTKARAESITLADDFSNKMEVIEESATVATTGIITAFAGLALEGGKSANDFLITTIDVVASLLDSVVPALVALIFGQATAANPILGPLIAAGLTAVLLGLVAAAKSALIRGKGSRMEGGYAGDGRRDQEMGVYHAGEWIHDRDTTKENMGLFKHLHKGGDAFDWFVNEYGRIERIVADIPHMHLIDDRRVPQMLTNPDGSAINNREVVRELQVGFKGMQQGMENLKGEFKDVKKTFKESRFVHVDGKSSVKGGDIAIVYEQQQARGNSG